MSLGELREQVNPERPLSQKTAEEAARKFAQLNHENSNGGVETVDPIEGLVEISVAYFYEAGRAYIDEREKLGYPDD